MQQSSGSMGHSKHRQCQFHKRWARSARNQQEMCDFANAFYRPIQYQPPMYDSVQEAFKAAKDNRNKPKS